MDPNIDIRDTTARPPVDVSNIMDWEGDTDCNWSIYKIADESDVCAPPPLEPEGKLDAADPLPTEPEEEKILVNREQKCPEVRFIDWSHYGQTINTRSNTPVCYQTAEECQPIVSNHDVILNKHIRLSSIDAFL